MFLNMWFSIKKFDSLFIHITILYVMLGPYIFSQMEGCHQFEGSTAFVPHLVKSM